MGTTYLSLHPLVLCPGMFRVCVCDLVFIVAVTLYFLAVVVNIHGQLTVEEDR